MGRGLHGGGGYCLSQCICIHKRATSPGIYPYQKDGFKSHRYATLLLPILKHILLEYTSTLDHLL